MRKLAILILNYNGRHYLNDCYDSLEIQTNADFDTWLIDNNSTDGSREFTLLNHPDVKVLNTGANLGYAGAYNYAFQSLINKEEKYAYYLLLNNDTKVAPNLVEAVINAFDKYNNAGIVVPTVVDSSMRIDAAGGDFLFLTGTTLDHMGGKIYKQSNMVYECFWASGCALSIRVDLLEKIGYFHEYFIYYEDVDLSWRVNNAGFMVYAIGNTYVEHLQGGAKTPSDKQLYLCERNRLYCYWQNLPLVLFLLYLPFFLFFRIVLLFHIARNPQHILSKINGLFEGLASLNRYPRKKFAFANHLKTLRLMNEAVIAHRLKDMLFKSFSYFRAVLSMSKNWSSFLLFYFFNKHLDGEFVLHLNKKLDIAVRPKSGDMIAVVEDFYDEQYLFFPLNLDSGGIVVDVGAHIGTFSLAVHVKYPQATIFCFEPQPETYDQLSKNIKINKLTDVIRSRQSALWTETVKKNLHFSGNDSLGASLVVEDYEKSFYVQCYSLSDIMKTYCIDRCNLLKIDIEGAEYDVIKSLTAKDYDSIGSILVEYHVVDNPKYNKDFLKNILENNGYNLLFHPSKPILYGWKI